MGKANQFEELRTEKPGYVYFSRLQELVINEINYSGSLFDYLIDIGDNNKQTGRLFGVEVRALTDKNAQKDKKLQQQFRNVTFPVLLVMFDNKDEHGYFKWIKKPAKHGQLLFNTSSAVVQDLDNNTLQDIVTSIKDWYAYKSDKAYVT